MVDLTRLDELIALVEKLHPDEIDLRFVWGGDSGPASASFVDHFILFGHPCGTRGCLLGWTCSLALHHGGEIEYDRTLQDVGMQWLDLTTEQANGLFLLQEPLSEKNPVWSHTKEEVLDVLRRFRETGHIFWPRVEIEPGDEEDLWDVNGIGV